MSGTYSFSDGLPAPQPDSTDAIAAFHLWLTTAPRECIKITPGQRQAAESFIPLSTISEYLTPNRVYDLLLALFRSRSLPVSPENVIKYCPRVFCALLCIGRGEFIKQFFDYQELRDRGCPHTSRPKCFPGRDTDPSFWRDFYSAQWRFFPVMLEPDPPIYGKDMILPYLEKRQIAQGGSAKLYRVVVAREYDKLDDEATQGEFQEGTSVHDRVYALKTYDGDDARIFYDNESQNFARLQETERWGLKGLVRFHMAYQHGDTFNIVLEYAEGGSLESHLRNTEPPSRGREIFAFWEALLEVLYALQRMHELKEPQSTSGGARVFQGIHQDIRPKNILVLRRGDSGPLKLCDLGITQFNEWTSGDDDVKAVDTQGGEAYGAPETFRETDHDQTSRLEVTRMCDIWSLGCVFMAVAVWIAYGRDGLQQFHRRRYEENLKSHSKGGYCFHNGMRRPWPKLLSVVRQEMDDLQKELKRSDGITGDIVSTMVDRMLRTDWTQRPTAAELTGDVVGVLSRAKAYMDAHYGSVSPRPGSRSVYHVPSGSGTYPPIYDRPNEPPTRREYDPTSGFGRGPSDSRANTLVQEPQPLTRPGTGLESVSKARAREDWISGHPSSSPQDYRFPPGQGMSRIEEKVNPGLAIVSKDHPYTVLPLLGLEQATGTPTRNRSERRPRTPNPPGPQSVSAPDKVGAISPFDGPARTDIAGSPREPQAGSGETALVQIHSEPPPSTTDKAGDVIRPGMPSSSRGATSPPILHHPPTTSSISTQSQKAHLSVSEVVDLIRRASVFGFKNIFAPRKIPQPSNGHYKDFLKQRDHMILVDDSVTMRAFADRVRITFQVITYMTIDADPDGIDVKFAQSQREYKVVKFREMDGVASAVKARVTEAGHRTDIKIRLGAILGEYAAALQDTRDRKGKSLRQLSIYVLTDGVWGRNHEYDADNMITEFARKLKELRGLRYQVGIQFISFGTDKVALDRLKRLDRLGKVDTSIDDIVDTTDHEGNVWKMLLGPIDTLFDDD